MNQQTMMFSVYDIKQMANHILSTSFEFDNSGSRMHHGLRYCTGCGSYEYNVSEGIKHANDCVTKIAQDVLTGIE